MKVAMVTQSYYPSMGGVTEHVHYLSKALCALGHEVRIITSGPDHNGDDSVIRLGRNALFPINGALVNVTVGLNLARRLRDIFVARQFDIIHIHSPLEPTLPLAALTAARSLDCPVIGTFHMSARVSPGYEVFSHALTPYADRLDARIAVSQAARRFAQKYFPGHYVLVPNGVDCDRFAGRDERIGRLNDGRINFLYVGRLDMRKKVPWLISAFKRAYRRNHHCRLVIIGKGLTEPACRLAAYRLPRDSVVFTGNVAPAQLPAYYLSSHIFCSVPSGSESFGIVLLEAMAAGKPVIATSIEGYGEIVRDGIDGILIRPGDTGALVDAMTRLAVDEAARLAMGRSGKVRARNFDWSRIAGRVEQVYCDLRSQPVFRGPHEAAGRKSIRLR
jgi:phosphatidylinositol alpha-mannosyltransferase